MEKTIANRLRELLAGVPGPERNLFSINLPSIIAGAITDFENSSQVRLSAGQRGAGTGKTTVLHVVHLIAEQVGVPILQMALSGRAAQRMREATGRPASTIAAFLRAAE